MPLILPGNVASATAGAYEVANSCRFNDGDSAYMSKTSTTQTSQRKCTISCWIKRGDLGVDATIFTLGASAGSTIYAYFKSDGTLEVYGTTSGTAINLRTNAIYRDPAAWYHLVIAIDTEQGTAANRVKIYINGVQNTSLQSTTYPAEDLDFASLATSQTYYVGSLYGPQQYFDGYLAEFVFIDGLQLAATSFGEFDSDSPTIWKPIDVSGLTFGNNGFYLDFEASANLGNDANGGTDLTETNIAAVDQCTDSPTNNFCVMNPLDKYWGSWTLSNGNNTVSATNAAYVPIRATVGLTAGKWYWEVEFDAWSGTGQQALIGICATDRTGSASGNGLAEHAYDYAYLDYDGKIYGPSNANASYGNTYTTGDIIGVYLDLDNNKLYFGKNGTIQASGTGFSIVAAASTTLGCYFPAVSDWTSNGYATFKCNFGSGQFGDTALSSAVADANGFGQFEYDPSDGGGSSFDSAAKDFLAICSANLGSDGG